MPHMQKRGRTCALLASASYLARPKNTHPLWTLEHAEPPKGRKPLTPYQTQNSPPPQRGDGLSGADQPQAIGLSATSSGYHPRLDHRLLPGNVPRDTGRRAISMH